MSQETLALDSAIQCNAAMYGIFDGSTSYVEVADNDLFSFGDGATDSPFSISAWIYMIDSNYFRILHKGLDNDNIEYYFATASHKLKFSLFDADALNSITVDSDEVITGFENAWIYVAATYNGGGSNDDMALYINGLVIPYSSSTTLSYTSMNNTDGSLLIGRATWVNYANGYIRDVRLYNKELSSAEVLAEYNTGQIADSDSLIAEYKLRGDCQDNSGNNLHGTNYNVTFPEEVPALALDSGVAIGGTSGPVLQFDGSDYYTAPALPNNGNDDFDINFNYYFLEDGINYQYIFHAYDSESGVEFRIRISTLNDLRVTLGDSSAIVYRLTDETTYLIRVIKVNNTITLYVDGDSKGSSIFSDEFTFDEYYLGGDLGVSTFPSNGSKLSTVSGAYQFSVAYTDILRTTEAEINDNIASIVNIGNAGGYFEQSEASKRSILESLCAYRSFLSLNSSLL